MKPCDLVGMRFSRLVVIERAENNKYGKTMWKCQCDCGMAAVVCSGNLKNGHTKSCGCLQMERTAESSTKHGCTSTKIYAVWKTMRQRCGNPNNHKYKDYGMRGISVCDEWKDSFQAFYDYVSRLPHFGEEGYSIDRINNNGNYEPGNVRWATMHEQRINQRKAVI